MRIVIMAAAVTLGWALVSLPAEAATITQNLSFTASGFTAFNGTPVPKDPMRGSFRVTLDDTKSYTDATTGLYWNAINMSTLKPLVFSYDPNAKLLTLGANGHASQYIWGTNDFTLSIYLSGPQPGGSFFGYSLDGHNDSYETYNVAVSTQSPSAARNAQVATVTPLPGSVLMLLTALATLGGAAFMRRRRAAVTIEA